MALNLTGGEGGSGIVLIQDRVDINPNQPIPAYDLAPAVAYSARHRRDPGREIIALVCDPKLPPRMDAVAPLQRIDNPALMRVVDSGIVDWAPEGRSCPVIVVEQPRGRRVFPSLDEKIAPMREASITRMCLTPAASVLRDIAAHRVVHRAIRPDNLFFDDEAGNRLVLASVYPRHQRLHSLLSMKQSSPGWRHQRGAAKVASQTICTRSARRP